MKLSPPVDSSTAKVPSLRSYHDLMADSVICDKVVLQQLMVDIHTVCQHIMQHLYLITCVGDKHPYTFGITHENPVSNETI